jgi:Heterokaryon incompatibility protein (HET)
LPSTHPDIGLINLNTLELREFIDSERPPYVILSHTWGADEVSLQQLHDPDVKSKAGYLKILAFAQKGKGNGFEWGWVDTCCIDKTSSAELSEAINSMYRWYAEADSCYAYLRDVGGPEGQQPSGSIKEQFAHSRWFTRGWTLQELLAPLSVIFYLQDWTVYGTKSSLIELISRITNIPVKVTTTPESISDFSVAQKISWASSRQTTRPEDLSYSLMGILGVNMPLLYGERTKAFTRLQEEVMRNSTDPTIFAWSPRSVRGEGPWEGHMAPSPAAFKEAGTHRIMHPVRYGPWSLTNHGIRIEGLPVLEGKKANDLLDSTGFGRQSDVTYSVALIGCGRGGEDSVTEQFGLTLYRVNGDDIYYRSRGIESLLILDRNIVSSKSINCIMRLSVFTLIGPGKVLPKWVFRELPETRHCFEISAGYGIFCGLDMEVNNKFSIGKELGFDAERSVDFQLIAFSNYATKEEFFVVIRVSRHYPWISVLINTTLLELIKDFDLWDARSRAPQKYNYQDRSSQILRAGQEVSAAVEPGVKDGKRVFLLDIYVRDKP